MHKETFRRVRKILRVSLTLSCLSQVSAGPTYIQHHYHLDLDHQRAALPFKSKPISLRKQTYHRDMTGCWLYHDTIYLKGFSHDTELQMRRLKDTRSERMLLTSLRPAVGNVLIRALGSWTRAVPLNANEWSLQRKQHSLKSPYAIGPNVKDKFT